MAEKCCTKCGQAKPISEFHKDKHNKGGLTLRCKMCRAADNRRYHEENAEKVKAYHARYYAENREKLRLRGAEWYAENREKQKASSAKWSVANKEKVRVNHAKWAVANAEKRRATQNRRRARKVGADGNATAEQIAARWEVYGDMCYICGEPAEVTDHVIPLAAGGSNWPSNLRPICRHCNLIKGPRWPYVFSLTKTVESPRFNQISYSGD